MQVDVQAMNPESDNLINIVSLEQQNYKFYLRNLVITWFIIQHNMESQNNLKWDPIFYSTKIISQVYSPSWLNPRHYPLPANKKFRKEHKSQGNKKYK